MIRWIELLLVVYLGCVSWSQAENVSGKVAIWSPNFAHWRVDAETSYNSKTMLMSELPNFVTEHADTKNTVIVLVHCEGEGSVFDAPGVKESFPKSKGAVVATSVYLSDNEKKYSSQSVSRLLESVSGATTTSTLHTREAIPFFDAAHNLPLISGKINIQLNIPSRSGDVSVDEERAKAFYDFTYKVAHSANKADSAGVRVLLVAVESPSGLAPTSTDKYEVDLDAQPNRVGVSESELRRSLSSKSQRSSTSTGQLRNQTAVDTRGDYKPAGTEWSMYHSGNHLYMTPEILTGLFVGASFTIIVLVALSCTNDISQTEDMSWTNEHGIPVIGKEA